MNEEEKKELSILVSKAVESCKRKPHEFIHGIDEVVNSLQVTPDEKANVLLSIGCGLLDISYFTLALDTFNLALKYFRRSSNIDGVFSCYSNLGVAYHNLGNFEKAIEYHEKALGTALDIRDRAGEAKAYGNLAIAYHRGPAELGKAIEYNEKALGIALDTGDKETEMKCHSSLGNIYSSLGNFKKSIEYLERALDMARVLDDRMTESICYGNIGNSYHSLGNFRKAIEYHEKALKIALYIGDRAGVANEYGSLGNAFVDLGGFRQAIEYYEKALEIAKNIGAKVVQMKCYAQLGIAYGDLGDFKRAIKSNKKALKIAKNIGDRNGVAACGANIGVAIGYLGNAKKAIGYQEKALEIAKDIGDRFGESICNGNLGDAYLSLGHFKKAIGYYEKSLENAKEIGDSDLERKVSLDLCVAYYNVEPDLAHDYCKRSIESAETIYGRLMEEEHKIWFLAQASNAYKYMIPLCVKLNEVGEAFEYTERSKSRALLDLLAATEIRPTVELTRELKTLLDDEETHLTKLREIHTRHLRQTKVPVEPGEVERIKEKLNLIYDRIERRDPEYALTRRGKPLSLNDIQDMLSSQKRETALLEYFVTENETYIFIISSKDRELHIETVPLSKEKLWRYLENYSREVVDYLRLGSIGQTWLGLSEYLIEPISGYLTEDCIVYFVPYGVLHYIPMHALELKGEPLINKHAVAYAPSASLIKFCQKKGKRGKLQKGAFFGGSPAISFGKTLVESEAKEIAELFNATPYTDLGKEKVLKNCKDKDIIHFSCHGYFDNFDPLSSGIILSKSVEFRLNQQAPWSSGLGVHTEVLTAREIFDMRLNAELVTLSACQTGLNKRSPGDELIGLTRAFLYAGSPSVVVSLWSVDARSTQELMLEFYKLLKNGSDKATALQEAQKRIMKKEEYSHPYYWAPFILVGDWE